MMYEKSHKRVALIIIHTKEAVEMQGHFSLTQCLIIEYGLPENSEVDRFATPVVAWDPRRIVMDEVSYHRRTDRYVIQHVKLLKNQEKIN